MIPHCVKTGDIKADQQLIYKRVCQLVDRLTDPKVDCHKVCRTIVGCFLQTLVHFRGKFANADHSWLAFRSDIEVVIDVYPWATASGPILLTTHGHLNPWRRLYQGDPVLYNELSFQWDDLRKQLLNTPKRDGRGCCRRKWTVSAADALVEVAWKLPQPFTWEMWVVEATKAFPELFSLKDNPGVPDSNSINSYLCGKSKRSLIQQGKISKVGVRLYEVVHVYDKNSVATRKGTGRGFDEGNKTTGAAAPRESEEVSGLR
jgi:hypothetical protein